MSRSATSSGWSANGSCCLTCPSPICCCGRRWARTSCCAWPSAVRPPARPPTSTTRSARSFPASGPHRCAWRCVRVASSVRPIRTGTAICRSGGRRSRSAWAMNCSRSLAATATWPASAAPASSSWSTCKARPILPSWWPTARSPARPRRARRAPARESATACCGSSRTARSSTRARTDCPRFAGWAINGPVLGEPLAMLTSSIADDPFDASDLAEAVEAAVAGGSPRSIEVDGGGATVHFRALPLRPHGEPLGALILMQDVTELRRRDRQILSKDATIREIHHRVKNNLQTVAALLRLQARRVAIPEAREALEESMRRVSSIAHGARDVVGLHGRVGRLRRDRRPAARNAVRRHRIGRARRADPGRDVRRTRRPSRPPRSSWC